MKHCLWVPGYLLARRENTRSCKCSFPKEMMLSVPSGTCFLYQYKTQMFPWAWVVIKAHTFTSILQDNIANDRFSKKASGWLPLMFLMKLLRLSSPVAQVLERWPSAYTWDTFLLCWTSSYWTCYSLTHPRQHAEPVERAELPWNTLGGLSNHQWDNSEFCPGVFSEESSLYPC